MDNLQGIKWSQRRGIWHIFLKTKISLNSNYSRTIGIVMFCCIKKSFYPHFVRLRLQMKWKLMHLPTLYISLYIPSFISIMLLTPIWNLTPGSRLVFNFRAHFKDNLVKLKDIYYIQTREEYTYIDRYEYIQLDREVGQVASSPRRLCLPAIEPWVHPQTYPAKIFSNNLI